MRKLLSFPLVLGLILASAGSVSAQRIQGTAGTDLTDPDAGTVGSVGRILTPSGPAFTGPRLSLLSRPGSEIGNEPGARIHLDVPELTAGEGEEDGGGIGGIIDWILGLSGPAFIGPRLSFSWQLHPWADNQAKPRIRLDAAYRWAVNKDGKVTPDTTSIVMQTLQLGIELPLTNLPIYVGPALALHRFTGDAFENVTTWSIPFTLQLRARNGWHAGRLLFLPLLSGSIHYFPAFEDSDFEGIDMSVSREVPEAVFEILAGFDIRFRSE